MIFEQRSEEHGDPQEAASGSVVGGGAEGFDESVFAGMVVGGEEDTDPV